MNFYEEKMGWCWVNRWKNLKNKKINFAKKIFLPIYLTSPHFLFIEVHKTEFWLFWYLFFWNWFGSLSGIKIAKLEHLEAVARFGGQERPPNRHNHIILIVRNPSITIFFPKNIGSIFNTIPLNIYCLQVTYNCRSVSFY